MPNGQTQGFITTTKLKEVLAEKPPHLTDETVLLELAKTHEVEGFNTEFSPLDAVGNIPESAKEFGKNIIAAIKSPVQTVTAISKVGIGGLGAMFNKLSPEKISTSDVVEGSEEAFQGMVDFFTERYGGKERVLETIERDPVGFLSDASSLLTGTGGVVRGAGKITRLPKIAKAGQVIKAAGRAVEPLRFAKTGLITAPKAATRKTAQVFIKQTGLDDRLRQFASKTGTKGLGLTGAEQLEIGAMTKFTKRAGAVLANWGVKGTPKQIAQQLKLIADATKATVDEKLARITTKVKSVSAVQLAQAMERFFKNTKSESFIKIKNKARDLFEKGKSEGLTLTEMNELKRLFDVEFQNAFKKKEGVPVSAKKLGDMARLRLGVQNTIEREAANAGVKGIKELNKQTQLARGIQIMMDKIDFVTKDRSPFLDRMIVAGGTVGSVLSRDPSLILGATGFVVGSAFLKSTRYRTWLATKLRLLTDREFETLKGGIKLKKLSKPAKTVMQKIWRDAQKTFPEAIKKAPAARLAGVAQRQEEQRTRRLERELQPEIQRLTQ
jgi:hypothetical protein